MSEQQPKFEIRDEEQLSVDLIEAQYALKRKPRETQCQKHTHFNEWYRVSWKREAVKQLREWLDPRYLRVKADAPRVLTDSEAFWQSYSAFIPTEGQIVVMFGNWYSDLLVTATHVSEPLDDARLMPMLKICGRLNRT